MPAILNEDSIRFVELLTVLPSTVRSSENMVAAAAGYNINSIKFQETISL